MNFPVWELEMGTPLLIAIVAILHVYVSHFAIGGGLFLVVMEHYANRKDDRHLRNYLITHSRFFALVTLVFGAISGVGIWFVIGLSSPAATSSLIHLFVWVWAIEWALFIVEIAAAIVYYMTWDRVSRRTHLAVGWVYFIAAFLSLVVINGILAFMLTPGEWLASGNFWDAFFNPTYWPSTLARTAICIGLAGIYALVTGVFVKHATTRARIIRLAGLWALAGTVLAVPALYWYHGLLPAGAAELFAGGMPAAALAAKVLVWGGIALAVILLAPIIFPRNFGPGSAITFALVALTLFGASEWIRESVRKPWVIVDYMYGNGLRPAEAEAMSTGDGILANAVWVQERPAAATTATGREVFRLACRSCHTLDGYRGLTDRLGGLDEDFIYESVARLEHMVGAMPAFPGSDVERRALARYLVLESGTALPMLDGAEVFSKRCGFCHSQSGFRALEGSLEGYGHDELVELFPELGEMIEEMPPWSGTEDETRMLADFIQSWYAVAEDEEEN
jgi:mono/diheme cytochrome c family protein